MQEKKYNKIVYNDAYNKEHYKEFKARLKFNEYEELEKARENEKLSKPDFLKKMFDIYKKNKKKKLSTR